MNEVRWGLLSTAHINRRLIPAIRASRRGELVAVASRTPESAEAYASEWEIPAAFGSYEEMLASDAIDAVYIGLPNHLHAEWTIRALYNGLHVLCEKPFTLSLKEMDDVILTARETGKVVAEAFMYRHHPQMKIVDEWIREGRLGEINTVHGIFDFKLEDSNNVRLVPEYGGGSLWDIGIYPLSFAQFVFGGPPSLVSGLQTLGTHGVDDTFVGQMRYPGGGLAQIGSSFRSPFHTRVDIVGTQGRLQLTRPFVTVDEGRITFYPAEGDLETVEAPSKELYLGEVEDMHAAILDGAEPLISLEESRDQVRTALALYASARSGQMVAL